MFSKFKGFTMVELAIWIAVTGVIAITVIPALDFGTIPFESAVEKLKHDIRHAQWEAMNRKVRHGVVFDPVNETYSVYQTTPSNIIADPLDPSSEFTVSYLDDKKFKGVGIVSVNINGTDTIEFDGRGFPYDATNTLLPSQGTIILSHDGSTVTVTIEANTGRVGN